MNLAVALIVTALAVTAFASVSTDNSSAENSVGIPTAVSDLVYDGNLKTGVPEGTGYTVTGNTATDAESYNATLTRESGYVWSDGTEDAKEITWSIAKGEIRLNITDYSSISYGRRISDNLEVEFNDGNRTEFNGKFTVEHSAGSGEYSTEVPKNAGGYYLKVTVTDPNIESPVLNYNFTISRIKLCDCDDYNFDMDPSGNITYDGNEHPVGICISTDRVYEQIDDSVTVSNSKDGSSYSDAKPVDVGTYSIKITAKPDTNYEEEKILENVLTIISKTVTVTINDVINAMNNNNTFDDSSLNSSLNNDYCRVVVKEDANYVITRDSNSNVILENKTTAAKVKTADVVVSLCSKVTFDINSRDAEGSMDDTIALNSYNLPECGYKAKGKHFVGWSLTPDGETIATKSVPVTEKNVTLYAIWEATEGTISSESTSYRYAADNTATGDIIVVLKEGESEYALTFAKGENVGGKTVSVTIDASKTADNVTAYEIKTDGIMNFDVKLPCQKGFGTASVLCDGSTEGVSNIRYNSEEGYVTFTSNHNSLFTITLSGTSAPVPSSVSESYVVTSAQTEGEDYSLIIAIGALFLSLAFLAAVLRR